MMRNSLSDNALADRRSSRLRQLCSPSPGIHAVVAEHPPQGWDVGIDVIVDPDFIFAGVFAVQPTGILLERTAPRNRHRKKEGIKPRIVEPLSNEASGGEHDAMVLRGGFLEAAERCGLPGGNSDRFSASAHENVCLTAAARTQKYFLSLT